MEGERGREERRERKKRERKEKKSPLLALKPKFVAICSKE